MKEWLQAFYRWIGTRSVLLLMDNFKAHINGVNQQPPPPNIRIQWLPANSTSIYQPLDQGIINQFKYGYKKQWIRYMLSCYERGLDPAREVSLYYTLRWASQAWFDDLSNYTIYRCFRRARIQPVQEPISLPDPQEQPQQELEELYQRIQQVGGIQNAMNIENFLNPAGEDDEPSEEFDLTETIALYSQLPPIEEESEDEAAPVRIPTAAEAEQAIELLLLYQEHSRKTTPNQIRALRQLSRDARADRAEQGVQITLDGWLT